VPDKLREAPPLAEIPVGREVREVKLLAKLLDGFANPIRLSVLLLLSRNGEMSVGELVEAIFYWLSSGRRCSVQMNPAPLLREWLGSLVGAGFE
jgi:hypothetical protein